MPACTFFGHGDCPDTITPCLMRTLKRLIEDYAVDMFYVGNHGRFDAIVRASLRKLKEIYPQIEYTVVLAYMPVKREPFDISDYSDTMLPEGIETAPRRFAISWRNKWMLRQSEYVVTYITHSWGGAAQFAELATKQKKTVFNIADLMETCTV